MNARASGFLRSCAVGCVILLGGCVGRMYVRLAPPPNRVEVISPQPGEIYVWTSGFWLWSDQVYVWSPGRWVRAPKAGTVWVPGEWRSTPRGYYWSPGRWREDRHEKESR